MRARTGGSSLRLRAIGKRYGSVTVLDGLSLHVAPSEVMAVLGPSGSGKTTALRIIAGFVAPDAGAVEVDGRDITGVPAHRRDMGMVFQSHALFPHMTVIRNVAFPLQMRGVPSAERRRRSIETLRLVGLDHLAARRPRQLSAGQQQRVALARALVFRPSVLLMDEPLSALDRTLRERLQVEIAALCRDAHATVVYVTHDIEEALTLGDRIAVCRDGRIEQVGSGADLYHRPATLFIAGFIGESNAFTGTVRPDGILLLDGLRRPVRIDGSLRAGERATVVVRPERVTLRSTPSPDDSAAAAHLPGRLRDVIDLGATRRWIVELEDGSFATVRTGSGSGPAHVDGPAVWLGWSLADGMIFAGTPG